MFKRKQEVDQGALDQLRNEIQLIQKFEEDAKSKAGKNLIDLIENTIEETVLKFANEDVSNFDTDTKLLVFFFACRGKLQTLMALRTIYVNAESKRKELISELDRLLPIE